MYTHRVFKIPNGDETIVFVPSLFVIYRINNSKISQVPDCLTSEKAHPVSRWDNLPDYTFFGTNLILTNHCNLACVYCYGNYGPTGKRFMTEQIALAAIDYIADCAQKMQQDLIYARMFGGEPTQAWNVLVASVHYLRQKAINIGCKSRTTITTNGCMSLDKATWLSENMDGINISFDGHKDIQDMHRSESFDKVFSVARKIYTLAPKKLMFIRSTISDYSVERLPEIVRFFGKKFPGVKQMYEPLFTIGRGKSSGCTMPPPEMFFNKFIEALPIAEQLGCKLTTSVLNLRAKSSEFCGVAARNFMITPDGHCVTCSRMTGNSNPTEGSFTYGHFDETSKKFVFNEEAYNQLKKISVGNIKECQNCFAISSCRGDCAADKAIVDPDNFWRSASYRCDAIRKFVKDALLYVLDREVKCV